MIQFGRWIIWKYQEKLSKDTTVSYVVATDYDPNDLGCVVYDVRFNSIHMMGPTEYPRPVRSVTLELIEEMRKLGGES